MWCSHNLLLSQSDQSISSAPCLLDRKVCGLNPPLIESENFGGACAILEEHACLYYISEVGHIVYRDCKTKAYRLDFTSGFGRFFFFFELGDLGMRKFL